MDDTNQWQYWYDEAYSVLEDIDNKGVKTEADLQNLLLKRKGEVK